MFNFKIYTILSLIFFEKNDGLFILAKIKIMKKLIQKLGLLAILFSASILSAQDYSKKIYYGIGLAFPQGKLSKANFNDSSTGYGTTGLSYSLRYEMMNKKGWGPYVDFQNASIGFDADLYAQDGAKDLGYPWAWDEYSISRYNVKSFNAGMQYTLNREQRFKVVLHAGLGLSICRNASIDVTYVNTISQFRAREKYTSDTKLNSNLNFGFMLVYDFKSKLSVFTKINYQNQNPDFKTKYELYLNGQYIGEETQKYTRPMYFSTTNLGLAYRLDT